MNNKTVREVMTRDPVSLPADASVTQAAKAMSDYRIGTVVVMEGNTPCGIVTDRDITVRTVAIEGDPNTTKLGDICSKTVAAVRPDQSVEDVMQVMKSHDVKRVLVIADSKLEGIVSLGDLAARGEGEEVEEDISRSEPNN
jgi:CBS domain-containing protein